MGTQQLLDAFQRSYGSFESYPSNLLHQTCHIGTLQAYITRLDNAAAKLFTKTTPDVVFRDFDPTRQGFSDEKVIDDSKLKDWLGNLGVVNPGPSTGIARTEDPKCRFIFIWAKHSRTYLNITRKMLVRILSFHQVMPSYLDFIFLFGSQSEPRDLRYSGFRAQMLLVDPSQRLAVPSSGRSGRQFQISYNLKCVTCKTSASFRAIQSQEWSIRQAAFHHQFDIVDGTTLWIVTRGGLDIRGSIEDLTGPNGRPEHRAFRTVEECFKSSLAVHLLYSQWSTADWRGYLQWLEDFTYQETKIAILGPRGPNQARKEYELQDLQKVQDYEDKTNEAIMILETNAHVLNSLRKFYESLVKSKDFPPGRHCREDVSAFSTQVNEMIYDSRMHIVRAKLLVQIVADRMTLISQHLQSQATQKMEQLTLSMHDIGFQAQKEAVAMRVITVVTLFYLPATFVSTFFSTDIVKYQNSGDLTASFSVTAMVRWLQVTIPLTVLTGGVAFWWFASVDKKRGVEWQLVNAIRAEIGHS
ncbi:MAG: hypothetical protein FRX48_08305 [Lasallia pustulata]|uniref:CorA-like transporter domain-containing protein n=1 Tax=Lasallia pustulata TaxID=136370 RepID=A0A5M8PGN8_9LECA|nr:MAG: hypothetical protein FRX48_08305 [Lasallia pustulata]